MGWWICPTTRSSTALKCHWLLFSNAVNCPSISLAPRILLGQCPIHRAEMGGKWRQREKSKEPMTSERAVEDFVGSVPGSSWWVKTGSWLVSLIEKGSKALGYDRRKMGDLVLGWQRFFCATGGSQGHSRSFVVVEKMIETWLKTGKDWTGMWGLLCFWLKTLKAKLAWAVTSCLLVCSNNSFSFSSADAQLKMICLRHSLFLYGMFLEQV